VTPSRAETLRRQMAGDPALRKAVHTLLDRCDREGEFPRRVTYRCASPEERDALIRLLSGAAVKTVPGDPLAARLDLGRAHEMLQAEGGGSLRDLLYAASARTPRNIRAERSDLAARASVFAEELARRYAGAAASYLAEAASRLSRGRGALFEEAEARGLPRLTEELDRIARCIALAEGNDSPIRLANFSRLATGSTKGLRAGDSRYGTVADALLAFVPGLAEKVEAEGPRDASERRRLALESVNIFRNETPVDVLCFGRFLLEKGGRTLHDAAVHFELDEPVRLLLLHLRGARAKEVRAERIVSIENETTFNDYVDRVRETGSEEVVLCSQGQANWAVVRLLMLLAEAAPSVPMFHWGDLDRSGVLILRSLRRRTGLPIEPLWMDVPTYRRFAESGLPLRAEEKKEIDAVLRASGDGTGSELLAAILEKGKWIEQETVADGVLAVSASAGSPGGVCGVPGLPTAGQ
jgi:hypothetical protein